MTKIDPIIAVKDVNESAQWYQSVFDCKRTHGGDHFAVLTDENGEVLVCLHKWGEHEHPTMKNSGITPGNGLILYYKTDRLDIIRANVEKNALSGRRRDTRKPEFDKIGIFIARSGRILFNRNGIPPV